MTPSITPKPSTLLSSHPLSSSPSELEANKQLGDAIPTLPEVLILIGLEETETPVWIKLVDILLRRKVVLPEERGEMSLRLPLGFFLIWVRDAQKADHPSYLVSFLTGISRSPLFYFLESAWLGRDRLKSRRGSDRGRQGAWLLVLSWLDSSYLDRRSDEPGPPCTICSLSC